MNGFLSFRVDVLNLKYLIDFQCFGSLAVIKLYGSHPWYYKLKFLFRFSLLALDLIFSYLTGRRTDLPFAQNLEANIFRLEGALSLMILFQNILFIDHSLLQQITTMPFHKIFYQFLFSNYRNLIFKAVFKDIM